MNLGCKAFLSGGFSDERPCLKVRASSWALQVRQAQESLSAAISKWEGAAGVVLDGAPRGLLEASQDGSHPMHLLEDQVVQLQADLKQRTAAAKTAARYFAGLCALSFQKNSVKLGSC